MPGLTVKRGIRMSTSNTLFSSYKYPIAIACLAFILVACGGGGGGGGAAQPAAPTAPAAPSVIVTASSPKMLSFSWALVSGATSYQLFKSADGAPPFIPVGTLLPDIATLATDEIAVHMHDWVNARYKVRACNAVGCTDSSPVDTTPAMIAAIGYVKASNTGTDDNFGISVALSADGNTLAVGAGGEASSTVGINSIPEENAPGAGAVYVYSRSGNIWSQYAYVKASNTGTGDYFGGSVSLSADGNTLAVGAFGEASSSIGIDSTPNGSATNAGAVYLY